MRIIKCENYTAASKAVAHILAAQIQLKPDCVLGLATGSTPIGAYEQLVEWYKAGELDFGHVSSVNLDEYRGLDGDHDQSYRYFMNQHLFNHVNIEKARTFVPDGFEQDSEKACEDYENIIAAMGGIDVQLLGLGNNGHIGFNEPSDSFDKKTHCVNLTESTINANARFFASADEVPKQAYTMGIGSIMAARKIVIMVTGEGKHDIVRDAFLGPITPRVPASALQLHTDVVLVGDEAALGNSFDSLL